MVAIAAGFVLLVLLILFAGVSISRSRAFTERTIHTLEVEAKLNEVQTLFERAESSRRGYLLRQETRFPDAHRAAAAALPQAVDELGRLIADNRLQVGRVEELRALLSTRATARDRSFALVSSGRLSQALAEFGGAATSRDVLRIRTLVDAMRAEERRLLAAREEDRRRGQTQVNVVVGSSGILLVLLAIGSLYVIRRYTEDLSTSREALRRLNVGLEDAVAVRTADLQRANDEIQRFAYIVSHDLRSPLVNVMGFTSEIETGLASLRQMLNAAAERDPALVSAEARATVEQDLPEAIGFIRASTGKMDRLINAILRLSREGRRLLTVEPLNMQVLLDSVVASTRSRAEETGATVTVQWPMPDLIGDRLATEQVFGNLVDNALKYLKPGRPGRVVLRGREERGRLIYEVEDNGRGIDPRDHERVFDLFRRAGVQDQAGEGIGLAHVRALVQRLGGSITVESQLDLGSVFRVSLPPRPPAEQEKPA